MRGTQWSAAGLCLQVVLRRKRAQKWEERDI